MQTDNDIIVSFYKNAKTGLSISNTFRSLLKAGHNFTLRQVQEAIKDLDEYHKAKTYKDRNILLLLLLIKGSALSYRKNTVIYLNLNIYKRNMYNSIQL